MEGNNRLFVLDASVLIKWFIEEIENKTEALKIKQDYVEERIEVIIPSLCLYEVSNTMSKKIPDAILTFSQILMLDIPEKSLKLDDTYQALKIINKIPKVSFYDAIYHAIAINHNATFITADEKYYAQTKSLKHIQLLKDYK